jgi:hypothetical protein
MHYVKLPEALFAKAMAAGDIHMALNFSGPSSVQSSQETRSCASRETTLDASSCLRLTRSVPFAI